MGSTSPPAVRRTAVLTKWLQGTAAVTLRQSTAQHSMGRHIRLNTKRAPLHKPSETTKGLALPEEPAAGLLTLTNLTATSSTPFMTALYTTPKPPSPSRHLRPSAVLNQNSTRFVSSHDTLLFKCRQASRSSVSVVYQHKLQLLRGCCQCKHMQCRRLEQVL